MSSRRVGLLFATFLVAGGLVLDVHGQTAAGVRRIVDACMQNDAFARAHPLRQPGAPKAA